MFGTTGGILVTDVDTFVTAWPPRTRQVGIEHPYGLWHVGWVAIGWSPGGFFGVDTEIYEGWFIESEHQDRYLTNKRVDVYVDTLFYKLLPGVSVTVQISNL